MVRRLRARPMAGSWGGMRVVVGVDFDEPSLATARWLARHCVAGTEIILVHVLPVPRAPAFLLDQLRSSEPFVSQVAPAMRGGLEGLASSFGAEGSRLRVRTEIRVGEPAEQLAAVVEEVGATLVCVGHARSQREGVRSGRNTVERLARRVSVPLLQGAPGARCPGRIVAGVDGGAQSDAVLAAAWALAGRLGARLDALHVLDEDVRAYARAMAVAEGDPRGARAAEQALTHAASGWLRERLDALGPPAATAHARVRYGTPGTELLAEAGSVGGDGATPSAAGAADLIVVGREGRDALGRGLPGGTTRYLLAAATVPVMVVPLAERPAHTPDDPVGPPTRLRWARPASETLALVDAGGGDDGGLPPAARRGRRMPARVTTQMTGRPA